MKRLLKTSLILGLLSASAVSSAEEFIIYQSNTTSHPTMGASVNTQARFVKKTVNWSGDVAHSFYTIDVANSANPPGGPFSIVTPPAPGSGRHCDNMPSSSGYAASLGDYYFCVPGYSNADNDGDGAGGTLDDNKLRSEWLTHISFGRDVVVANNVTLWLGFATDPTGSSGGLETYWKKSAGGDAFNYNMPWGSAVSANGVYWVKMVGPVGDNVKNYISVAVMGNNGMDAWAEYVVTKIKLSVDGVDKITNL